MIWLVLLKTSSHLFSVFLNVYCCPHKSSAVLRGNIIQPEGRDLQTFKSQGQGHRNVHVLSKSFVFYSLVCVGLYSERFHTAVWVGSPFKQWCRFGRCHKSPLANVFGRFPVTLMTACVPLSKAYACNQAENAHNILSCPIEKVLLLAQSPLPTFQKFL